MQNSGTKLLEFDQDLHIYLVFAILTQQFCKAHDLLCALHLNISKVEVCQNHPEGLLKHCSAPLLVSDSVSLRWSLSICLSEKFPGDADAAV